MRHKLAYGSAALAVFAVGLFAAGTGSADNGTTTDTTTTEAATTTTTMTAATATTTKKSKPKPKAPGLPKPPWADPANYTLNLPVKTQVGPVCAPGDKSGKTCHYVPLGGTVITVRLLNGKVFSVSHTAANGRGKARLPKGRSKVTYSHSPWKGHPLGGNTYTVKAPVYMPPPNYFLFTFCLVADC